jgi:hypothetical protein
MKIIIHYDEKQNFRSGNFLGCNLQDMAWSLDKNLKKHHKASVSARFTPGRVELDVAGVGQTILESYLSAFQKAMVNTGFRVIIEYDSATKGA